MEIEGMAAGTEIEAIKRTSAGLREALFDEIDRLRRGDTDAKTANAIARIAGEIVNTVTMEIQVARAQMMPASSRGPVPVLPEPVDLSADAAERRKREHNGA